MRAAEMPAGLRARLRRIEDPLLVARYATALEHISGRTTRLSSFHVDMAGYSPEVAEELGDPFYLGQGADHPFFILLGVAQLSGCLLQPNAGFAALPLRLFAAEHRAELADLTLREAVFGEFAHGKTAIRKIEELALVREVAVSLDTVTGRITIARSLAEMREKLLASDTLWHDDDYLDRMRILAHRVQGYLPARGGAAVPARVPAAPSFLPRFAGAYVVPRADTNARERAWVLASGLSEGSTLELEGGRVVVVNPLTVDTVLDVLSQLDWIDLTPTGAQLEHGMIEALQTWLALDYLRKIGELDSLGEPDPSKLRRKMRQRDDAPADFLELEEVRMKAARPADWVELKRYTPLTRLRVLALRNPMEEQRALVRHVQAFLDPANVPRAYRDAPDLFWARRDEVPAEMFELIPRWIDTIEELSAACR